MLAGMEAGHAGHVDRRLLDAILSVASELDLEVVLQRIVEAAAGLVGARYAALGVVDEAGTSLERFHYTGISEEERRRMDHVPRGRGLLGLVMSEARPIRVEHIADHPASVGFPPGHPPMDSFLGVPLLVRDEVFGNLYLCDKESGEPFTARDEELVVTLAAAAGVAVQNARLHARVAELVLVEERDRIARDLHDHVIQGLFATGLSLQGAARLAERPDVVERIEEAVDELDRTIRQIRATIFELQPARLTGRSVRREVLDIAAEASRALGWSPEVRFQGPVDTLTDERTTEHLVAALRELLANVARHAQATKAWVTILASPLSIDLVVEDDGIGPGDVGEGGRGIANLRARAASLGGTFHIGGRAGGGTVARWRVPFDRTRRGDG